VCRNWHAGSCANFNNWNVLRWPVIVGLLIVAMALVYYLAPDVEQQWQWITPGSIVAVLGWLLASPGVFVLCQSIWVL
jgi:uncharacterized BrkB/YihY/UPF0761 family membrane protein